MAPNGTLGYDVFISEPIPIAVDAPLPNGERRMFSALSTTLIYGTNDAVLVDPPLTTDQAASVGDWIKSTGKNVTISSPPTAAGITGSPPASSPIGLTRGSSPRAARSSRCTTTWPAVRPCGTRHIPGRSRRPPSATPTASWARPYSGPEPKPSTQYATDTTRSVLLSEAGSTSQCADPPCPIGTPQVSRPTLHTILVGGESQVDDHDL